MEYKDLKLQEVISSTTKVRGFPDDIYNEKINNKYFTILHPSNGGWIS